MLAYNFLTKESKDLKEIFTNKTSKNIKFLTITPHSGEYIPYEYLKNINDRNNESWKKDIDHHSNKLYDLSNIGSNLISTNIHRGFIDLNRSLTTNNNDGVIKKKGFNGFNLINVEYTKIEKKQMLENYYFPFYNLLNRTMFDLRKKYDSAFLLNGHSMEELDPKTKTKRPDFCIGTLDNSSANKKITKSFTDTLTELCNIDKLKVEIDYPFKGKKNLSKIYSFPKRGYNTLLLEINQRLYMDNNFNIDQDSIKYINKIIEKTMEKTLESIIE